jgi:SHS family lactate transporter-like MFS transporter
MIMLGAFLMQFMVQGAWGVIPAHIIELSPHQLRGFFPGFAYQVGVLCASSIGYIESSVGEHLTYSTSMSLAMVIVIGCLWLIIKFGPEEHGKVFVMLTPEPAQPAEIETQLRPTG